MLLRHRHFARSGSTLTRKQREREKLQQQVREYQSYVTSVGSQIGELSPLVGEELGQVRFLICIAARTLGLHARTWIDSGRVYFFIRHDRARLS